MPPKAKITQTMVIDAAFKVARKSGAENINARTVSEMIGCSTQPVMYHFKTIEELKIAVYQKADTFRSAYLTNTHGENELLEIGLNYIRFAYREKNLFRLLFQTSEFSHKRITELLASDETEPILYLLRHEADLTLRQAEQLFQTLFFQVHGYASVYANNSIPFDEKTVSEDLKNVFYGLLLRFQSS